MAPRDLLQVWRIEQQTAAHRWTVQDSGFITRGDRKLNYIDLMNDAYRAAHEDYIATSTRNGNPNGHARSIGLARHVVPDDVAARWDEVEAQRGTFLESLTDAGLHDTLTIQPTTGGAYVHTLQQTLQHAVDHSSYHRGQIVTMLRQLGVKPPSTGLIGFYREQRQ